jgi:hypothetical protein
VSEALQLDHYKNSIRHITGIDFASECQTRADMILCFATVYWKMYRHALLTELRRADGENHSENSQVEFRREVSTILHPILPVRPV